MNSEPNPRSVEDLAIGIRFMTHILQDQHFFVCRPPRKPIINSRETMKKAEFLKNLACILSFGPHNTTDVAATGQITDSQLSVIACVANTGHDDHEHHSSYRSENIHPSNISADQFRK
jgi:hypothetical protein